jgi:hypothetical protein
MNCFVGDPRNDDKNVPQGCGTHRFGITSRGITTVDLSSYFEAVVLFSMFTTCTRRFTSAIGWFGSFSLLLP